MHKAKIVQCFPRLALREPHEPTLPESGRQHALDHQQESHRSTLASGTPVVCLSFHHSKPGRGSTSPAPRTQCRAYSTNKLRQTAFPAAYGTGSWQDSAGHFSPGAAHWLLADTTTLYFTLPGADWTETIRMCLLQVPLAYLVTRCSFYFIHSSTICDSSVDPSGMAHTLLRGAIGRSPPQDDPR